MMNARVQHGVSVSTDSDIPPAMGWMAKGKCLRVGLEKMFLAGRPTKEDYQKAKDTYCIPCPVRGDCLHWIMMQELKDRYVSGGIWGGLTPDERRKLRRRISDTKLCVTDTIRRWLKYGAVAPPDTTPDARYEVRVIDNDTKQIIFDGPANQDRGAHTIAVREMHRHDKPATAYITDRVEKSMVTLESANFPHRKRKTPCHEQ